MIHRAMFGSLERFTGILIEHHAGHLPLWLAPVQAMVAPIVSDADAYATKVLAALQGAGLRAEADLRNEKINYKVREHSPAKVPVMFVVGKREAEEGTVSLRRLGSASPAGDRPRGRDQGNRGRSSAPGFGKSPGARSASSSPGAAEAHADLGIWRSWRAWRCHRARARRRRRARSPPLAPPARPDLTPSPPRSARPDRNRR